MYYYCAKLNIFVKGTLDILTFSRTVEEGAGIAARRMTAIENNFDHDAFFMKALSNSLLSSSHHI